MSDVTAGLLQREEQLKRVAISLMIRGCGSVLAFAFTFKYSRSLPLSVAAMCGIWLAVLLFYDVQNAKALIGPGEGFFRFDRGALGRLVILSLPLGWVATFASLTANIPRYFLEHYMGLADQGIFASLAYLVVGINLVVSALSASITTRLARLFAECETEQFVRLLVKLSMLGVLIAAIGVPLTFLMGRTFLTVVYSKEYGNHVALMALLVAIAGISTIANFLFCGVTAAREFRAQVPVYLTAMVAAAVGSALLVPRYGLIGAGVGLLLSAMTLMVGGMWVVHRVLRSAPALAMTVKTS